MIRILAIDPGSRKAGFGVIEVNGRKFKYIAAGTLDIYQKKEFLPRLLDIPKTMRYLMDTYQPDEVVFESLIYVKSPTALMKLAQTRGAMVSSFGDAYKDKLFEYSPNVVKKSVTGHGHAGKDAVEKSVSMILGVHDFDGPDATDALAIALCHGFARHSTKHKIDEILSKEARPLYKSKKGLASQLTHKIK